MNLHFLIVVFSIWTGAVLFSGCPKSREPEREDVRAIDELCHRVVISPEEQSFGRALPVYADSKSEFVRTHLADSLGLLAESKSAEAISPWAVPVLLKLLHDQSLSVRSSAAKSLGLYSALAAAAAGDLADAIVRVPNNQLAWNAARALGRTGDSSAQVIDVLVYGISYVGPEGVYQYELCESAASAIAELGPPAARALPALRKQREIILDPRCRQALDTAIQQVEAQNKQR